MLTYLKKEKWSPYTVGFFIALLAIGSFFIFHKTIGVSTTFVKLAALFWSLVDSSHACSNPYYQETLNNKAWIDWQLMLVIGIFFGAYISRKLSSNEKNMIATSQPCGPVFENKSQRKLKAFIGGIILLFGARLSGGCTSGHAISGGFQLALSGWLFMMSVFAVGIPMALVMYRKKNKEVL